MNDVQLDFVLKQLGGGSTEVQDLAVNLGFDLDDSARLAPSIIVRSEAELFGCSSPRFSYRLYFKGKQGFINLRRLKEMGANIRVYESCLDGGDATNCKLPQKLIADLLMQQSCIADCLLPRPSFVPNRFHVISTSLSAAYGETSKDLSCSPFNSTPYVKNIALGGGLCAQAACFMSAAILHNHASGVHGLAEITALAHTQGRRRLSIIGMDSRLMQRYFSSVSLSMTVQGSHPDVEGVDYLDHKRLLEFELALEAYCRSDMPVIFPADYGRLVGFRSLDSNDQRDENNSIYGQNGFEANLESFDRSISNRHCFVIVGYCSGTRPGEGIFLFNDPGAGPYMQASVTQLANVGTYVHSQPYKVDCYRFSPVTPSAVKMPLSWFQPPGSFRFQPGLLWSAAWYRTCAFPNMVVPQQLNYSLTQLENAAKPKWFDIIPENNSFSDSNRIEYLNKVRELIAQLEADYLWSPSHWIWLEVMPESIWLWDAETEPVTDDPSENFVARIYRSARNLEIAWPDNL